MSSFLKKQQEENKNGDQVMEEEDDDDDYDDEVGDECDVIKDLNAVQDGIGAINMNSKNEKVASGAVKATQMFSLPKPPQGNKPLTMFEKNQTKYDPIEWTEYFDSMEKVDGKIPIYFAGTEGHVFLCLHGAGHSALSFATLAKIVKSEPYNSTCVAFDFRGHGGHYCENETEMSQATLIQETINMLKFTAARYPTQSIILVGHSMGGSIATKAIDYIQKNLADEDWYNHVKGLFIIDVVEGSAMDALPFMESIVQSRPQQFSNVQSVIKYGFSSGTVRDLQSARVSMPAQVVKKTDPKGQEIWVWRTDLLGSKQYWVEWFKDLTNTFLDLRIPKQLLLAGNDRMDKELTIAHMQGKFKMVVVDNVGHVIHEDRPQAVAKVFKQFLEQFHIPAQFKQQMVITTISGKKVTINQ